MHGTKRVLAAAAVLCVLAAPAEAQRDFIDWTQITDRGAGTVIPVYDPVSEDYRWITFEDLLSGLDIVFPGSIPTTWGLWVLDGATPTATDIQAGSRSADDALTASVELAALTTSEAVRLYGFIPSARWPLTARAEMTGVFGGIALEFVSTGHDVDGADYTIIRTAAFNPGVAGVVRTVTWWPATQ